MIARLFFASFILLAGTRAGAQTGDERAITHAIERLRVAMIDGNREELQAITFDKLSYGHSSGLVETKSEFIDKIVSGRSDFVTIDLTDQTIAVSGKTAIVRHKFHATTNDSGRPGEVNLLILLVFQKQQKAWKLLARQAVKAAI